MTYFIAVLTLKQER